MKQVTIFKEKDVLTLEDIANGWVCEHEIDVIDFKFSIRPETDSLYENYYLCITYNAKEEPNGQEVKRDL